MQTIKQRNIYFLLFFIFVFIGIIGAGTWRVLAITGNADSQTGGSGGGGNSCVNAGMGICMITGMTQPAVAKFTLVYYDGNSRSKVNGSKTWYLANWKVGNTNTTANKQALKHYANGAKIYTSPSFKFGRAGEKKLEHWVISFSNGKFDKDKFEKNVLSRFGVDSSVFTKETCVVDSNGDGEHSKEEEKNCVNSDGTFKPGYRIIVEPIFFFYASSGYKGWKASNRTVAKSTKDIAQEAISGKWGLSIDKYRDRLRYCYWGNNYNNPTSDKSSNRYGDWYRAYTEFDDIGIKAVKPSSYCTGNLRPSTKRIQNVAQITNGIGYWIFDPGNVIKGKCEAFNYDHYKANREPGWDGKTGSGPDGQNCCIEVGSALKNYSSMQYSNMAKSYMEDEYQEIAKNMGLKYPISYEELYDYWLTQHTECLVDQSKLVDPELTCGEKEVTKFGDEFTTDDLLATIGGESDYTRQDMSDSKFLVRQINSYCKILCGEELKMTFPDQLQEQIGRGTKIVWPTKENAAVANNYPLTVSSKATCVLNVNESKLISDNTYTCTKTNEDGEEYTTDCVNWSNVNSVRSTCKTETNSINKNNSTKRDFYDLKGKFNVWHTDEEYGKRTDIELERYDDGFSSGNYKTSGFPVSGNGSTFTIEQTVKYKIPDRIYRYIITKSDGTIKSSDTKSGNYTDLGYGNLPVSYTAEGVYDTFIKYSTIGGFKGKEKLKNNSMEYICEYKVNTGTKCECPEGPYMGKDLTQAMAGGEDGQTHTCEDAQKRFCDTPYCPDCENDCPTTFPSWYKDYTSGDFAGNTVLNESCKSSEVCTALSCNLFVCPPGTNAAGRPLNAIIAQYLANHPGKALNQDLLEYLVECSCSDDDNIIYRTIDLKNPFPGKDASGRRAGFNWDSDEIKASVITNNRGVADDQVYSKQPLYHFTLTPAVVKTIREYNSKAGNEYDDFKLDCKGETEPNKIDGVVSRNCISDFVHSSTYGAQADGSCYSAKTADSFVSCANK